MIVVRIYDNWLMVIEIGGEMDGMGRGGDGDIMGDWDLKLG